MEALQNIDLEFNPDHIMSESLESGLQATWWLVIIVNKAHIHGSPKINEHRTCDKHSLLQ